MFQFNRTKDLTSCTKGSDEVETTHFSGKPVTREEPTYSLFLQVTGTPGL